jgi:hypothetical protein
MELGMKVERKLSDFFVKKRKWHENMKTEMEICGTEGGSESGNGTVFSGETNAQTEVSVSG